MANAAGTPGPDPGLCRGCASASVHYAILQDGGFTNPIIRWHSYGTIMAQLYGTSLKTPSERGLRTCGTMAQARGALCERGRSRAGAPARRRHRGVSGGPGCASGVAGT